MRLNWRGYGMFGAGLLLGSLATGVLFAPPELANQPPPWEHMAQDQERAAAATHAAGAGPAQPVLTAAVRPVIAASAAAPQPLAVASQPLPAASQPAAIAQAATAGAAALAAPAAPQPDSVAMVETVARPEPTPKPVHKRSHERVVRHADQHEATDSAAQRVVAPDNRADSAPVEQRASEQRSRRDAATDDTGNTGVAVDTLHLPPERAPRSGTLSGPPATTPVTRAAATHDDSAPTSAGETGSGDASQ